MSDGRQVLSELRANMVDVLSYLVPGGTLLALILHLVYPRLEALPGWDSLCKADVMKSGWLSFLAFLAVLGAAYVLGTLLKTIDSWFGPKWSVVLDHAVSERMREIKGDLVAALPDSLKDLKELAKEPEENTRKNDVNVKLHNVADVLVRGYAPGVLLSWQERQEWLQNLYGGVAWALWIGTGAIIIQEIAPARCADLLFLVCALPAVRWRIQAWFPGPDGTKNPWRWIDGVLGGLVLGAALVLALLGLWPYLGVLAAAALGDALKRRQWALRAKAYNIMWHAALLVLRPVNDGQLVE